MGVNGHNAKYTAKLKSGGKVDFLGPGTRRCPSPCRQKFDYATAEEAALARARALESEGSKP